MREKPPVVPGHAAEKIAGQVHAIRDPASPGEGGHDNHDDHPAPRQRRYRGHTIEIVTRYEITIDGKSWDQHVRVMDDGTVHYHGMPQYSPLSLVDLMERVVDIGYAAPKEVRDAAAGEF